MKKECLHEQYRPIAITDTWLDAKTMLDNYFIFYECMDCGARMFEELKEIEKL